MMNKHIISTAAFLLAGTALSGAATVISTSFTTTGTSASNVSVSATSDTLGSITASLDSLKRSNSTTSTDYTLDCAVRNLSTSTFGESFLAPNVNVSNEGASGQNIGQWQATFSYSVSSSFEFGSISISTFGFNNSNGWQDAGNAKVPTGTTADGSTTAGKYVGFTVEYSLDGSAWTQVDKTYSVNVSGSSARTTTFSLDKLVSFNSETSDTLWIRVSTSQDYENGTFAGLSAITVNNSVLPEPSAFGLLAGLGALAFVAARRRRSRKAA